MLQLYVNSCKMGGQNFDDLLSKKTKKFDDLTKLPLKRAKAKGYFSSRRPQETYIIDF